MSGRTREVGDYLSYECRDCGEQLHQPANDPCAKVRQCPTCHTAPDVDADQDSIGRADL